MLYEVKYGIQITMTRVTVDPLAAPLFDFFPGGGVLISYDARGFFAAQLTGGHSGPRAFKVTRMAPGTYTVSQSVGNIVVGADGVLAFSCDVGAAVNATRIA